VSQPTIALTILFGLLAGMGIAAVVRFRSLANCDSCEPRCPNAHRFEIEGNGTMVSIAFLGMAAIAGVRLFA
jgi:hypothetical protein